MRRLDKLSVHEQVQIVGVLEEHLVCEPEADPVQEDSDGGDEIVLQENSSQSTHVVYHRDLQDSRRQRSVYVRFYGKMQNNIGTNPTIDQEQFKDKCRVLDGVGTATIHRYFVVDTSGFDKIPGVLINGGDGVDFVAAGHERTNQIHPEIVDIPGRVQDNGNSHLLALSCENSFPVVRVKIPVRLGNS